MPITAPVFKVSSVFVGFSILTGILLSFTFVTVYASNNDLLLMVGSIYAILSSSISSVSLSDIIVSELGGIRAKIWCNYAS